MGRRCAAAQPVYCLTCKDRAKLRLQAAIDRICQLFELPPDDPALEQRWLSTEELPHHFANFRGTVASVGEITARCDLALPDGHPIWPTLNVLVGQIQDGRLAALIEEGGDTRYGAGATAEIRRRLQHELASTTGMLRLFFLIVANIMAFARRDCLPVRTRGSTVSKKPDRFVRLNHKNLAKPTHSCQVFAQFLNLSCPP